MKKIILITGATDGIGFVTAKSLLQLGHRVLLHGRSDDKLSVVKKQLLQYADITDIETYSADLSVLDEVEMLAKEIQKYHQKLDVLVNNAGVFVVPDTLSKDGLDVRFVVNTIAPYLLTKRLLPLLDDMGRVINLSSAAQAPIQPEELAKPCPLPDNTVYAKSKLALTMWSRQMALSLDGSAPIIVAVNPKSFLGSKMVTAAYGVTGSNLQDGADILIKAALSEDFSQASGLYFDNDIGRFASPHEDALNKAKIEKITQVIEQIITAKNV